MKKSALICVTVAIGCLALLAADESQPASLPVASQTNAAPAVAPIPPAVAAPVVAVAPVDTNASAALIETGTNQPSANALTAPVPTNAVPPAVVDTNVWTGEGLRLNFRGASLETVLDYLSDAAGFIIILEAQPRGKVDVWSNHPVGKEDAVNLLNTVLRKNGYAAIRNGRTLTIVNRDEAKTKDIPVILGSDPQEIPRNDEIVTQIIPVRFVEAVQLIKDLQPLVSMQTSMTANESGNSIVITDSQANIRRVAEIIRAIDLGAEDVTLVRVFKLNNSDPSEIADLLTSLFPEDSRSGSSQSPVQFGGFRGLFGGGRGGPGGGGGNTGSTNPRIKKRTRVLAVPDARTSSVIVSAAGDLMEQIEGVIAEIDQSQAKKQTVKVFPLQNADPEQAMQVLEDIFQKNSTTSSSRRRNNNQGSALENRSTQQLNQQNTANRSSTRGMGGSSGGMGR